ncbi:MAG: hypothetical protein ABIK15_21715 [Pseudomonadota bacterium]
MDNISTITVVLQGELGTKDLETMADRIRKAIRGDAVPAKSGTAEFKSCDGINIKDWVCIGSSK